MTRRISIPVALLEFDPAGHTIWVHGPDGGTVLRIKTAGKIRVQMCSAPAVSHADIVVREDIQICVASGGE